MRLRLNQPGHNYFLSKRLPPEDGASLGFGVIGREYSGSVHTFSCTDLEIDYAEKLEIAFNAHGLIPDEAKAFAAAEYTNRDETGAEPVAWCAVKLYEFDLEAEANAPYSEEK